MCLFIAWTIKSILCFSFWFSSKGPQMTQITVNAINAKENERRRSARMQMMAEISLKMACKLFLCLCAFAKIWNYCVIAVEQMLFPEMCL